MTSPDAASRQPAPLLFLTTDWVTACAAAINASESYRAASVDWTHGAVALVVNAEPALGIARALAVRLDLERGSCRQASLVSPEDAAAAPFVLSSDYSTWKQVLRQQLSPVAGLLQRRITLKGSLSVILRYMKSAAELVAAVAKVPTRFPDE